MAIKVFKRYEKKYVLDETQYKVILELLKHHMHLDKYCNLNGGYNIYNIYCDTENHDIIRKSISGAYYKEKLRIRSYNAISSPEEKVFFELKKKIGGIVSKRRAVITLKETIDFIENLKEPKNNNYVENQVIKEIAFFLKMNKVSPKVLISYNRIAYFGKDNKDFRITFDTDIRSRRNGLYFEDYDYEHELLEKGKYLMEIKTTSAIPLWLTKVLSDQKIYSTSFSKYGLEFKKYCMEKSLKEDLNLPKKLVV